MSKNVLKVANNIPTHIRAGVKRKSIPIHYLISKDEHGRECYFVLICSYAKLRQMLSEKIHVKPQDYGHVVVSGFGKPSQKIHDMLVKDFGFVLESE